MGYALANNDTYEEMQCGECGIVFYVPAHWRSSRKETGERWYCPNGHCRVYTETESARLRRELAAKEQALQWARQRGDSLDRRLKQVAGKHKALQARVKAGVCPCCQRTFKQLAAHMQAQHPDYAAAHPDAETGR